MALRGMRETIKRSPNMKLLIECSCNHADLVRFLRALASDISVTKCDGLSRSLIRPSVRDNFAQVFELPKRTW